MGAEGRAACFHGVALLRSQTVRGVKIDVLGSVVDYAW
jgi:hypothetical protein